uniref:Tensin 3 n=1 Tax=Paramormyrops kingsleyae TaxID=1676925 RepID=A0A3B3S696_9TELE
MFPFISSSRTGGELDLTYITERIIAVSFPHTCTEESYLRNLQDVLRMLRSKHGDNYLVINLSEKRYELSKMNPKTMDTGWPDLHAPPLDKMCTICKAMETWLNANPQHVVVIHCRGGKGRIGVIISSYVHFTNISASADQALDRFAMRRYHDDKVSALMTPSQKRYVWILNSLLTGCMKMNTSLVFLHHVVLHGIPNFDIGGVCQPYLKVYQGMQAVYTSGIYTHAPGREVMFRVQFHTGIIHGCQLTFDKEDLEHANKDPRFPDYGKIELLFSESPEKLQGGECWQNGPEVTVDYNTGDPMVRWDSYENLATDWDGRRDGKSHFNGSESLCANGGGRRPAESQKDMQPTSYPTGKPSITRYSHKRSMYGYGGFMYVRFYIFF